MTKKQLSLKGLNFQDLQQSSGLKNLDKQFLKYLQTSDFVLYEQLLAYRQQHLVLPEEKISQLGCQPTWSEKESENAVTVE